MTQSYRPGPDGTSRFTLSDGRPAVYVPRDRTDYSGLHGGYPLTEDFLSRLATDGIDTIVLDDGEQVYVFDRNQYKRGNRVGHAPYPMKRVVSLEAATTGLTDPGERPHAWDAADHGIPENESPSDPRPTNRSRFGDPAGSTSE